MPPVPKPDPVKDAADRIGDALKDRPGLSGQIFSDAAKGVTGIDAGGKTIVDAIKRGSGKDLDAAQQGQAIDTYAARPGTGHTVHKDPMDGGQAITVEPKDKAAKYQDFVIR